MMKRNGIQSFSRLLIQGVAALVLLLCSCRSADGEQERKDWEAFKALAPIVPARCGISTIDETNAALAEISARMVDEVVIPYVELDREGHIAEYKLFRSQVNDLIERREKKKKPIAFEDAVRETYASWKKEYGEEKCRSFLEVLPVLENMQAQNQIVKTSRTLLVLTSQISSNFNADISSLVSAVGLNARGMNDYASLSIFIASSDTIAAMNRLIWGLTYLSVYDEDHAEEQEGFREALADIKTEEEEEKTDPPE